MLANSKETECINFAKQFYKLKNFINENPKAWEPWNFEFNRHDTDGIRSMRKYREMIYKNSQKYDEFLFDEPYQVSESKSFIDLWKIYGLVEQRIGPFYCGPYGVNDTLNCIQKWIEILYNDTNFDIFMLEKEIKVSIDTKYKETMNKIISGSISMVEPIEIIPSEINKRFGKYN